MRTAEETDALYDHLMKRLAQESAAITAPFERETSRLYARLQAADGPARRATAQAHYDAHMEVLDSLRNVARFAERAERLRARWSREVEQAERREQDSDVLEVVVVLSIGRRR